jgi:transposase
VTDHHRFMLRMYLDQYDRVATAMATIEAAIDAAITRMDQREAAGQASFRALILLLTTIPGVGVLAATVILAEIGTDMSRFPTAGHLLSWAGLCPGQNESAGKRRASRLRKGAPWLKVMLVQCAWAARRKKGSDYNAQFHRLCTRHGKKKAVCAIAASMLTAIYHMLKNGTVHHDLGAGHFDRRPPEIKARKLVGQLTKLGFEVELRPLAQAA